MTLPDLTTLAEAGGWVVAIAMAIGLISLFVLGKVVPGSVVDAQKAELKELRELVKDDILPAVKEVGAGTTRLLVGMEFLSDFVKEVARRDGRERRGGS